jgi:TIR domain-containing protein
MARKKARLPHEVFRSHANRDHRFANWLKEELQRLGVPVWYSETQIVGAQQWHDEIGKGLERCDWFLLVLSPSAIRSIWVKRELLFALDTAHFNERIIPVILRPCEPKELKKLSWTLSSMQHVDFTESHAIGLAELLRIWGIQSP